MHKNRFSHSKDRESIMSTGFAEGWMTGVHRWAPCLVAKLLPHADGKRAGECLYG